MPRSPGHRIARSVVLGTALLARPALAQPATRTADLITGLWTFRMEGDNTPQRVSLTVDGDSIRGRVYGQALAGTVSGQRITFNVGSFRWRGTLGSDSIRGWLGISPDSSRWSAQRYRPPATARRYAFTPKEWFRELTPTAPPALRLYPGDTVQTTTVDAAGWGTGAFGARGNKLTIGGNPLTGPFYVEGTLPGDVLVVKLLRVRLNRDWAFSGTSLMDNAIQPSYAAERRNSDIENKWTLDTAAGVARLTKPTDALRAMTIPLTPFLGAIAVAASDGVPSTRDSGPYGGNMEYAQLREGTTLYLPVNVEGARLFLGDGHAAQGDGELTGDALETSMDVVFTVDVLRYRFHDIPRAESATEIMSIGVAGSLDQALRQATSDMARWLQTDYKLTANEAALLMGFSMKYDIPDIVGPWVGVSARIPKTVLRQVRVAP